MIKIGERMQKRLKNYFLKDNMVNYNAFAETFSKSRKNMKWPELDAILDDIEKHNFQSILDVWCWSGRFLEHFFVKFWFFPKKYYGIDGSENMILEARKNFPENNFLVYQMQDMDIFLQEKIGKFDAIVFLASFHHLYNERERVRMLKNMKNFLSENGKIYMTNWNLLEQERYRNSYIWNGDFQIKIWEYSRYYHGFSLEELEKIFREAELEVLENCIFDGGRNIFSVLKNPL